MGPPAAGCSTICGDRRSADQAPTTLGLALTTFEKSTAEALAATPTAVAPKTTAATRAARSLRTMSSFPLVFSPATGGAAPPTVRGGRRTVGRQLVTTW